MDPYSWPVDAEALTVPLLVLAYAFLRAPRRRWLAFAASQLLLLAAFATPLHTIAVRYLLSVHLLQNVVIAEWAPALAVFGIPPSLAGRVPDRLVHPVITLPL